MFIRLNPNISFLLSLVVSIFILDRVIGLTLNHFYFSEEAKKNDKLIKGIFESNADIMIFGSSRAQHHYNPAVITKETGLSCYNLGMGGQNIYFHKAILNSILERYSPKVIILELMTIDIEKTPPSHDREKLGVLLPFYYKSLWLRNAVLLRGQNEKFKTLSDIYPFNSTAYTIFRNNWWPLKIYINGYIPIHTVWEKEIETINDKSNEPDSLKIAALFDFIRLAQSKGCKLMIAVSPHFVHKSKRSEIERISLVIKEKFDIEVLNLEQDSAFLSNKTYFGDPFHLNSSGADLYSTIIARKINEIILSEN